MFAPADLFDLNETEHAALFEGCRHAWEALPKIKEYIAAYVRGGRQPVEPVSGRGVFIGGNVFIGEGTVIEEGAYIFGPAIIGRNCLIRHNAYIRTNVIVGDGSVVGNASELNNAFLFNRCQVPHFNYVGDSILGFRAHIGAGVKISNLKLMQGNVVVEHDGVRYDTGLRKFGAMIGDRVDVGCNAVLNPGTVLGRDSIVYSCVAWRGVLPPGCIAKNKAAIEIVTRRSSPAAPK